MHVPDFQHQSSWVTHFHKGSLIRQPQKLDQACITSDTASQTNAPALEGSLPPMFTACFGVPKRGLMNGWFWLGMLGLCRPELDPSSFVFLMLSKQPSKKPVPSVLGAFSLPALLTQPAWWLLTHQPIMFCFADKQHQVPEHHLQCL